MEAMLIIWRDVNLTSMNETAAGTRLLKHEQTSSLFG